MTLALFSVLALAAALLNIPCGALLRAGSPRMQIAPPLAISNNVVAGGDTANIIFGKVQRAAQLPTTRFNPAPLAAVDNGRALSSMLWGSFAMSAVPSGGWLEPERLTRTAALCNSLVFLDQTTSETRSGMPFGLPFGKKNAAQNVAGPIDLSVVEAAGARGSDHLFLVVEAANVGECKAAIDNLAVAPPTTIIAPADGVSIASTKGWVQKTVQDHEGVLEGGVALAADDMAAGGVLAREDLAEVVVQCALRLSLTPEEGAPLLRVIRVAPSADTAEREVQNYDSVIGGPKFRAKQGTVVSADWSDALKPFGVIKKSDPDDWRLLVDVEQDEAWVPSPKPKAPPKPAAPEEEEEEEEED